jgi:hypothetical protein
VGTQMYTAYKNHAQFKIGTNFRTPLNWFFDIQELRQIYGSSTAPANNKKLARAHLADIASFKEIISKVGSYHEAETRSMR